MGARPHRRMGSHAEQVLRVPVINDEVVDAAFGVRIEQVVSSGGSRLAA